MKTNYGTISRLSETLSRMSGLTGRAGFAIARTKRMLKQEAETFEELRSNLVKKYGEKNKDDSISVKPGGQNWNDFLKEYTELYQKEVDVDIIQLKSDEYNIDDIYCENATADDYEIFEAFMVEKKEDEADDKSDKGGDDKEDVGE